MAGEGVHANFGFYIFLVHDLDAMRDGRTDGRAWLVLRLIRMVTQWNCVVFRITSNVRRDRILEIEDDAKTKTMRLRPRQRTAI